MYEITYGKLNNLGNCWSTTENGNFLCSQSNLQLIRHCKWLLNTCFHCCQVITFASMSNNAGTQIRNVRLLVEIFTIQYCQFTFTHHAFKDYDYYYKLMLHA